MCFWHDPQTSKQGPDIRGRLERLAHEGYSLEGFVLDRADLRGVDLTPPDVHGRVNLAHASLVRANLADAHLFSINFTGASLLKADCSRANLNQARLEEANLLGVDFHDTRLEHARWGARVLQERRGHEAWARGRHHDARDCFLEAEEIYRALRKASEERGYFDQAGEFFRREMIMRRLQMPRGSLRWAWSKGVDLVCGYGERPARVVAFALAIIVGWALAFFVMGVRGPEGLIRYDATNPLLVNGQHLLDCLYYSTVTFTTLGYGDIAPLGHARPLAAAEAFLGSFTIALFVVVFVRRMTH